MATQFIEDPDTKEKISFEWDKPTPPTSEDIDSLFKSVKASQLESTLSTKRSPASPESIYADEPSIRTPNSMFLPSTIRDVSVRPYRVAKTALEMLGIGGGAYLGGTPGAGAGYALAKQAGKLFPGLPPRAAAKQDFEQAVGTPLSD
jgi:hypothetical protein